MAEDEKDVDAQSENSDIKDEQESASEPVVDGADAGVAESNGSEAVAENAEESVAKEKEVVAEPEGGSLLDGVSAGGIDDGPLVKSVEMSEFGDSNVLSDGDSGDSAKTNIDMILDISIPIAVELGRTSMMLKDVLTLAPGSVVELTKLAGDTVDLMIRGKLIARGEVVVVDDNFGMRITSICDQEERLKQLS
ncbi:MAG: flagellar motor switch protein FliN [Candidatus Anammoxibacter sp.]